MVMVLAAGLDALIARRPRSHLQAPDQIQLDELLERAVDARPADRRVLRPQLVLDLERTQRAALTAQELDDRGPRAAAPVARAVKRVESLLGPVPARFRRHTA